jgi:hypothetical protein
MSFCEEFIRCCQGRESLFGSDLPDLKDNMMSAQAILQAYEAYSQAVSIMVENESEPSSSEEILRKLQFAKKKVGWKCTALMALITLQQAKFYFHFKKDISTAKQHLVQALYLIGSPTDDSPEMKRSAYKDAKELESKLSGFGEGNGAQETKFTPDSDAEDDLEDKVKILKSEYQKGFFSFVEFVFNFFPPIHIPKWIREPIAKIFPKKLLRKLLTWYHPDKIDTSKYGVKYQRQCEEISKFISSEFSKSKK